MKIGIIVYSRTGNTLSVAEKLKDKLTAAGHSAEIEQVRVAGGRKSGKRSFQLETRPDVSRYDALVFGSAVEAFSLSPVMKSYLIGIDSLQGKLVACLVTQFFPYPWMGGNRAIRQMHELCESKGAMICGSAVVNWVKLRRETTTARAVDGLSSVFQP
ncbi:MAG TPA: flavodoxin family protein [Candidatus Acetothermia bacterium]|nr:flavodoxin family protein [Candidatus Acetothermia bacterium]